MPFGIGGGTSKSSSQSESSSFDNLDQVGLNIGGSQSSSSGQSTSTSRIAFEDVFAKLFGGASGAAAGIDTSSITDAANMLFGGGTGFLDQLSGGGAGAKFLEDRLAGSDRLADEQIGLLEQDLGRFLSETVNPAITSGGVQAGTLGGGRGEVQRGIASRGASEAFVKGATDIRLGERARTDSIAQALASDETNRAGVGIGSLGDLLNLVTGGTLAGLEPFAALSQILGPQTVLSDSQSSQSSDSLGFDFGFDQTTGRAASESSSSSSSSSKNFSFGL